MSRLIVTSDTFSSPAILFARKPGDLMNNLMMFSYLVFIVSFIVSFNVSFKFNIK